MNPDPLHVPGLEPDDSGDIVLTNVRSIVIVLVLAGISGFVVGFAAGWVLWRLM